MLMSSTFIYRTIYYQDKKWDLTQIDFISTLIQMEIVKGGCRFNES